MIAALLIGRGGSTGLPGKNTMRILGRPLMTYPIMAAHYSNHIDDIFLSSDSDQIKWTAMKWRVKIINRPEELANKQALAEDAFKHGYEEIKDFWELDPEILVLLFCNGATIKPGIIDEGIEFLMKNPEYDSAVTVSQYDMYSPIRAHTIGKTSNSLCQMFTASELGVEGASGRSSMGDVWFPDCSAFIVRPRNLKVLDRDLPFPWTGPLIYPLLQWGGMDIDLHWQVPAVEYWLKQHGFTEEKTPYDE